MRQRFDFSELRSILTEVKNTSMLKVASDNVALPPHVASAAESLCRVADTLDEIGREDLADELISSARALIDGSMRMAAKEDGDGDKEGHKPEHEDELEEVMSVQCPYCSKEFDIVVELEDDKFEVESLEEEAEEHGDGAEKEKVDSDTVESVQTDMDKGLPFVAF